MLKNNKGFRIFLCIITTVFVLSFIVNLILPDRFLTELATTAITAITESTESTVNTSITKDRFISEMEKKGFSVADETESFHKLDAALVAVREEYEIFYCKLSSRSEAKDFFKDVVEHCKDQGNVRVGSVEIYMANQGRYTVTIGDTYYIVTYVDDTVIYAFVEKEFKSDAKEIFKDLGHL